MFSFSINIIIVRITDLAENISNVRKNCFLSFEGFPLTSDEHIVGGDVIKLDVPIYM